MASQCDIVCADCIDVMALTHDDEIDLTVTSPPYDDLRTYNGFTFEFEPIAKELFRVTKPGGVVVWVVGDATVKGSETGTSFRQALFFKECGFNLHDTMIFQKNGTGACGSTKGYWQTFEFMYILVKGRIACFNPLTTGKPCKIGGARHSLSKDGQIGESSNGSRRALDGRLQRRNNIWLYNVGINSKDDVLSRGHPAKFPEALAHDHILSWSNEGDLVFDPFLGSGTTAKMALQLKRRFLGAEISEEYVRISQQRIEGLI